MPKLLWVLLPLAATALWLALLAWRGRLPSRQSLNVLFSLLLLGYVGGTAGLGIFWVSNQQLPVFDWHYLFGYATVLVLLVHLGFNLRVVWQHLRRTFAKPPTPGVTAPPGGAAAKPRGAGRRPLLGAGVAAALAGAAGLGYFVGLRHGRTELLLAGTGRPRSAEPAGHAATSAPAAAASATSDASASTARAHAAAAEAWAVVERFHAFSAHSRARVLRHAASTDWGGAPAPFKRYAVGRGSHDRLLLPPPSGRGHAAEPGHREGQALRPPDLAALGTWLWHTTGISERRGGIAFRTSPSSGALFATELYVLAQDVHGVDPAAWWHYDAQTHALQRLPTKAAAAPAAAASPAPGPLSLPPRCHALVVASAVFARSGHKYGDRTYRYVLADLGHALENLRRASEAHGGLQATPLPRFDEAALAAALALDERREGVLAAVALAPPASDAPAPAQPHGAVAPPGAQAGEPVHWTSALHAVTAGHEPARLGLTEAMHAATSLRAVPVQAVAPRLPSPAFAPAASEAPLAAAVTHLLPPARPIRADPLPLIARRRSLRRFSAEPLSQQALANVLQAMTAPAPQLSRAVRIDVLTAAVAGVPQAAWRLQPGAASSAPRLLQRVHHGDGLRARARAAALDQDVIGDAAAVFVLSLDRAALQADVAGAARGYRHGFLEAGLVGERIYLAAGALGLGACAVGAFYDDEAAALVGLDAEREWPVHFAALGVPG